MDDKNFTNEKEEQISSIPEVKVEEVNININSNNIVNNDTKQFNNETGSKKSTILLILLFIFLSGYVFAMPYIDEFIDKLKMDSNLQQEEKSEIKKDSVENDKIIQESISEKVEIKELVCTSSQAQINNYTLLTIEKFYYDNNNQVLNSKIIYNYDFLVEGEEYNLLKKKCEEDSLKYLLNEGYTTACSYENLNIQISHEFDLETFTTISEGDTIIQANAFYKQNIDEIKNNLISKGYICE